MPTVKVENGNLEAALVVFKRKAIQEGILRNVRDRMDGGKGKGKKGKPKSNAQ